MDKKIGKRILMTLIRFDIGGAETHVLELALELQRMGYHVVIASNGGVYEKNLADAGITHYKVPMHSKSFSNVAKSLKLLHEIIKKENIEIVHAHGRIPAFLCGILKKVMDFTFVTTAHWVFDTSHGLKYITNWGEKVVAVSEDIKTYLMDNYKVNPTDIYVTINGIDTIKFSKDADFSDIMEEFSLKQDTKKIVYISRMDADRALVAFHLAEIVPELVKVNPDIEVVIVGNGNVFDELKEKVDKINETLGKKHIILTGGRTDIYKFAAMSDIFVGVSRSALEAMACEKPVIVAGNEGYLGIFDEDKLENAIDTNFCCRGLVGSTPELLLSDLTTLLTNKSEENGRLGSYGRQIILNNYSLSKMANDCIKMYNSATDDKKWDAVLMGYYGFDNSGDEALLYSIIKSLKAEKEDVRLLVLSKTPKETEKTYGIYSINRYNLLKAKREIKKSRLFIFGGGSLIQDVTSDKSLWYYLSMLKLAISAKIPVMVYANGIGPVKRQRNRKMVSEILNKTDVITLRDENSLKETEDMQIKVEKILTADPVLSIGGINKESAGELLEKEGIKADEKLLAISVRDWKECDEKFWTSFTDQITEICQKYDLKPVFIPLKKPEDVNFSKKLQSKLSIESYILKNNYTAEEIIGIFGVCELVIGMRLHSIIYAAAVGTPSVGISYDPKVSGFVDYIGTSSSLELNKINDGELLVVSDEIIKNHKEIKEELKNKVVIFKEKSIETAKIAMKFIKEQ